MRVNADIDQCVGAGQCVLTDPTVFGQGDEGLVTVLNERPEGESAKRAREAAHICPAQALTIVDEWCRLSGR
jgi:ferredoxin